ncbi:MAG: hypothetical protein GWM92_11940, partial [Gemmatimonadetes bacterium]|nr:hypothetical protein [Gemmatimonadota bacterium]NIR79394.1 hypothetical protein [Gemmatimonadota bacterium]NIT88067.1 hypothetical protein [Gemmatimonadota bacterium]NIU31899.1 hypothetical protein [Gemmatimonadota bacterium]NIU36518.1 hypothetical protein [Gemmatimonadota bacterium]
MTNDGAGDGDTRVRHVTTFFLGLAAAIAAGFLLHASEAEAWRTSGSILEVLGLVLAVLAVDGKVAKVTGRPRIFRRLLEGGRRAWRRVLSLFGRGREGRSVTLEAGSGDVVTTGAEARMSVRPAEDADVERWIRYLKEELEALRSRV